MFSSGLNCPTNQCQAATGGNPLLKPETSDSWTLGLVITPTFLSGFTATVDYYNIKIGGFITNTPISSILAGCYSTTLNPTQTCGCSPYCLLVHRDPLGQITTANVGYVVSIEGNIGGDKVQGFDAELNYDVDLNDLGWEKAGSLSFNVGGLRWSRSTTQSSRLPGRHHPALRRRRGEPNCGEPQNRFKSNVRLTWTDNKGDFSPSRCVGGTCRASSSKALCPAVSLRASTS